MTVHPPRPARLGKEEWLELEARTDTRYEYLDGFVYAMAGETKPHNTIVLNIAEHIRPKARAKGCEFQFESVRA